MTVGNRAGLRDVPYHILLVFAQIVICASYLGFSYFGTSMDYGTLYCWRLPERTYLIQIEHNRQVRTGQPWLGERSWHGPKR